MRSCSSAVLVQQTAEQVAPTQSALLLLGVNSQPGGLIWRLEPECPVRAVGIVRREVLDRMLVFGAGSCGRYWPRTPIVTTATVRIVPWGNATARARRTTVVLTTRTSYDEIGSHEYAQVA